MKEAANLCKCNNCNNIFIDQNPQIGAKVYNADTTKLSNLQYITDNLDDDGEAAECYWGCGICMTDGYLNDFLTKEDEENLKIKDIIA